MYREDFYYSENHNLDNICTCMSEVHDDSQGCLTIVKPPYKNCYLCYHGHARPEQDSGAESGEDQAYQKGEDVDF